MRRQRVPTSWFRRWTHPIREFIKVDLDMTEQALRRAHPSVGQLMCAPAHFMLWVLDEMEGAVADLRSLMTPRRPGTRPSPPSEPLE